MNNKFAPLIYRRLKEDGEDNGGVNAFSRKERSRRDGL